MKYVVILLIAVCGSHLSAEDKRTSRDMAMTNYGCARTYLSTVFDIYVKMSEIKNMDAHNKDFLNIYLGMAWKNMVMANGAFQDSESVSDIIGVDYQLYRSQLDTYAKLIFDHLEEVGYDSHFIADNRKRLSKIFSRK